MADTTIRDAVLKSFTEAEGEGGDVKVVESKVSDTTETDGETENEDKVETPKPEKKVEKVEKDKKVENEEEEDDVLEIDAPAEDIKTSLAILRALRDPNTSASTIEFLAKQAGYDLANKKEVKQLTKDFKTILKEGLGDSYEFVGGDKFASTIEEAVKATFGGEIESRTKPVLDRLSLAEASANQVKADSAMDAMWKRNEITDPKVREKIAGKMLAKMEAMPAGPSSDINSYLDDIYSLVTKDQRDAKAVKKAITKVRSNAEGVERTPGGNGPDDDTRVRKGSRLPSIKEAVEAAFRNERLE